MKFKDFNRPKNECFDDASIREEKISKGDDDVEGVGTLDVPSEYVSYENDQENRRLSRAELWEQLSQTKVDRNGENQALVTNFAYFWAGNAGLFCALCTVEAAVAVGCLASGITFLSMLIVLTAIATGFTLVGSVMGVAWYLIQRRQLGHVERLENLIDHIERVLGIPSDCASSARINDEGFRSVSRLNNRFPARAVKGFYSRLNMVIWTGFFCGFLVVLFILIGIVY